jgi:ubiquinone/menaquinone biosynthesis C-methylase UbiE
MTNDDQAKQQQRQLWDSLAAAWEQYDAWFQRQTHTVAEWLCRVADLRSGQRVLDLACGSGQPALTAARLVKPGGSVVATDLSEEMVRVARRKANMADMDNIEFRVMDAENIEFPDETFDAVTCRWGLMFCPDPSKAIREVHRVLKPNRPFATTTFAAMDKNPFMAVHFQLAAQFLGAPMPGPDAPTPVRLSDTGRIQAMLKDAGFQNVEIEARPFIWEFNSFDDFYRVSMDWAPAFRGASELDEATKAKLRDALETGAAKYKEAGKLRFPALAIGAYAQK